MYSFLRKLKSCRNTKKKFKYSQIWPTKALSRKKLKLFSKNSRKFMIELGKPLKVKFKISLFKLLKNL